MMTESKVEQEDAFQELLESHYAQIAADDPLQKIKAKAWECFLQLGLPTRELEVYRYIRLKNLLGNSYVASQIVHVEPADIASYIYPECIHSVLVVVNGHYCPALSNFSALPKRMVVSTLRDATRTYGAFLQNQWTHTLKEERDAFAILNAALHQDGLFLYLPPKTIVETPVQILHVVHAHDMPMFMHPRLHVFAGAQAQLHIASSQALLSGSRYCTNQIADFTLEEDAHVHYTQTILDVAQEAWHLDGVRATLKRNSNFKSVCITEGSATVRNDYRVTLTGENAEASLNGAWMLADKREAHVHVLIEHQAPHCRSMQLFKGVLNDNSKSSFEGKILVRQAAQKTEAFQLNNNLLLSERAHADCKPNLEIFADDVKASHGATFGPLDKEELFYMETRGISNAEAKNILVYGFCKEVIDKITLPSLCQEISRRTRRYLIGE